MIKKLKFLSIHIELIIIKIVLSYCVYVCAEMPSSTDCSYSIRKWACWVSQYDNWYVSTEIKNKSFLWVFKFLKSINSIKSYGIFNKSANSSPRYEKFSTKYANFVPNLFKYANFSHKCANFAVKYTYFSSKYTKFAPRSANFTLHI